MTAPRLAMILASALAVSCSACSSAPPPRPSGEMMNAVVYHEYGDADVLHVEQIDKLLPNEHQVLVKVHAAAINPLDWHFMLGTPYLMRLSAGLTKPEDARIGVDVSGTVVEVGKAVTKFKPGDEVFGTGHGSLAEYVLANEKRLALKPAAISFEQAAAIPVAALTALQALRDQAHVAAGQKVIINGASGGVGTFAVQIAKAYGAEVTAVCSGKNIELVRSLGADHVIDYTKQDFTLGEERYDVLIDNVGTRDLLDLRRALKPDGVGVLVGGGGPDAGNWIGPLATPVKALFLKPFVSQKMHFFMADITADDLAYISGLETSGKVRSVIDRSYPLAQAAEAMRYLEAGHAHGKVVITVE